MLVGLSREADRKGIPCVGNLVLNGAIIGHTGRIADAGILLRKPEAAIQRLLLPSLGCDGVCDLVFSILRVQVDNSQVHFIAPESPPLYDLHIPFCPNSVQVRILLCSIFDIEVVGPRDRLRLNFLIFHN